MHAKVEDPEAREATLRELQQLRDLCSGSGSSEAFSMSLLLRARAKLSAGKAPGPDNVTVMMLKQLSWSSLRRVLVSFECVYSR
eukprot:9356513-Pyramimonas_sp.AAC.1